ncbi:MAG: HAMP domain-containing protein [Planctomycetes bacterium]|nr:HAMP domain-containing protein [Planctomycetota bacterium]
MLARDDTRPQGAPRAAVIRRISTKFLLAVLAAVVLPFLALALFVETQMAGRLSKDVVLYSLKSLAADLAVRVDRDIEEFNSTTALLAADPGSYLAIDEAARERRGELDGEQASVRRLMRDTQVQQFDNWVLAKRDYDLLMLVSADGRFVVANTVGRSGLGLSEDVLDLLRSRDHSQDVWFEAARNGQAFRIDQHRSVLLPPRHAEPAHPENFHIAFSAPVYWPADAAQPERSGQFLGALCVLVNWARIQEEVESPVLKSYFQGLVGPDEFPSAYGWIWASDADTILAHRDPSLYGQSVSTSPRIRLPELSRAARASDWGLYPEYEYAGRRKNAAFKHTHPVTADGFGWIVGVGIDNDDIFEGVRELRAQLFQVTALVLLVSVLWTMLVARRTTAPVLELREQVLKVAGGDLAARNAVRGRDELGELGRELNRMTDEIRDSREKLVRAEKEAAWREMARQVAHDIKNPLTPIQVSAELCKRAHDERSKEFERIFERTIEITLRQVAHLREVAGDFHALTGVRKDALVRVDVGAMLTEVLELYRALSIERGVAIEAQIQGALVLADASALRRVLQNLVSNAFEAMPQGGMLVASVQREGGEARITLHDSGEGLSAQAQARLFEPYFTTRSQGTGLGLAIARRVVEDLGGSIELHNVEPGRGVLATMRLPLAEGA